MIPAGKQVSGSSVSYRSFSVINPACDLVTVAISV